VPFNPADYPATGAALEGGSFFASLTEGDPMERGFLASSGYVSVVAAGERAADGSRWLLEVFGDPQTSSGLSVAEASMRSLVHIAVRGAS